MSRVALYGGSFNPPHVGHQLVVGYVLATAAVDEVWLVPCFEHAFAKELVSFEHRFAMCEQLLAVFTPERVKVSDIEARIGKRSYTVDTVRRLLAERPGDRFDIVVGTDIFEEADQWKEFDRLVELCEFIVIGREGYPDPPDRVVGPPLLQVSSTEVRERLARGEGVGELLPRSVVHYIREHGLYR